MVVLRLVDIDLPQGVEHFETDWQVSKGKLFKDEDIVCQSVANDIDKTSIYFNEVLDPTIEYYARARVRTTHGYTIWGNVDIFIPEDINDIELDSDMPTNISVPTLTSSADPEQHIASMFTIYATGFTAIGTASHTATSWFIEDLEGNVIWKRLYDKVRISSIEFNDMILKQNKAYRIKALFHSSSRDVSQIATKTIVVGTSKYANVLTPLVNISPAVDETIRLAYRPGILHSEWKILYLDKNYSQEIWSEVVTDDDVLKVIVPKGTLQNNKAYALMVKTNLDMTWSFYPFSLY